MISLYLSENNAIKLNQNSRLQTNKQTSLICLYDSCLFSFQFEGLSLVSSSYCFNLKMFSITIFWKCWVVHLYIIWTVYNDGFWNEVSPKIVYRIVCICIVFFSWSVVQYVAELSPSSGIYCHKLCTWMVDFCSYFLQLTVSFVPS